MSSAIQSWRGEEREGGRREGGKEGREGGRGREGRREGGERGRARECSLLPKYTNPSASVHTGDLENSGLERVLLELRQLIPASQHNLGK